MKKDDRHTQALPPVPLEPAVPYRALEKPPPEPCVIFPERRSEFQEVVIDDVDLRNLSLKPGFAPPEPGKPLEPEPDDVGFRINDRTLSRTR